MKYKNLDLEKNLAGPQLKEFKNALKWDLRFLELARFISSWSKDPSTKCGAVIVDKDRRIISVGYNGFPKGVEDSEERLNNREIKYRIVSHAESNAILFAQRSLEDCSLYTWPFMPCSVCAGMVIQSKIAKSIAPYSENPRWKDSFELSRQLFYEACIINKEYNLVEDNGDAIGDRPQVGILDSK